MHGWESSDPRMYRKFMQWHFIYTEFHCMFLEGCIKLFCMDTSVADPEGVPRVPWNSLFAQL